MYSSYRTFNMLEGLSLGTIVTVAWYISAGETLKAAIGGGFSSVKNMIYGKPEDDMNAFLESTDLENKINITDILINNNKERNDQVYLLTLTSLEEVMNDIKIELVDFNDKLQLNKQMKFYNIKHKFKDILLKLERLYVIFHERRTMYFQVLQLDVTSKNKLSETIITDKLLTPRNT